MSRTRRNVVIAIAAWVPLALLASTAASWGAAAPPAGRYYFVASLGLATVSGGSYELGVGCLRFTETQICTLDNECGTWETTSWGEPGKQQGEGIFSITIIDDESGSTVQMDGVARIDSRGHKSSIAGVARAKELESGLRINLGIVGRQATRARCIELVNEYEAGQP